MKRSTKFTLAITGIIAAVALAVFIFVPGLLTYISVNFKYDHINESTDVFEKADVPEDFVSFDMEYITLKMPKGTGYKKDEYYTSKTALTYKDKNIAFVTEIDTAESEKALVGFNAEYDPFEYYDNSKEDYQSFFKKIGEPFPKDMTMLLYFTRDKLNSKMCLRLRGDDMKVFREMTETKEGSFDTENMWHTSGKGYTAYISEILQDPTGGKGRWTAAVFPESDKTKYYFLLLNTESPEMARQILSTIELS